MHVNPMQLPLHSSLCCSCKPEVICYEGYLSVDQLVHLWDSVHLHIKTTRPATLELAYGNSSLAALSGHAPRQNVSAPLTFSPYGTHCVALIRLGCASGGGGADVTSYSIDTKLELFPLYPIGMAIGLSLLMTAPTLSRYCKPSCMIS